MPPQLRAAQAGLVHDTEKSKTGGVPDAATCVLRKTRWRLGNAKLPRPTPPGARKWRLKNAKHHPPATSQHVQVVQLKRLATWDKSPLHGDDWLETLVGSFNVASWKCQASEFDSSETRTTNSDVFSSLASDDEGEEIACQGNTSVVVRETALPPRELKALALRTDVTFEGDWGCASISNGILTWREGEAVDINVTSRTSFRMNYVGKVYDAWLVDDGKLHWDDGDVWVRGPISFYAAEFDCDWGCASICNAKLSWKDGEEVAITVLSCRHFKMTYAGKDCGAWLLEDGKLQWDDGDVWARGPVSFCAAEFDCDWGCASIGNGMLVWKVGEEVAITVISCSHFKMTYAGKDYKAWLLEDGKLQWDDGDVWVRRGKEASESIDRTWKAVNTAEAEVTALDPRAKQHLRFPCDQRHKQNTVPARQTASSQRHGVASASVWRPSELRRHSSQPKDGPVLARSKGPAENVSSYAAVEPRSKTPYEGNIKYFRGSYGWVYSPDVQKEFGGADVFLHINDCGDGFRPRQGDAVTFQLSKDQKGNPKAVQALPPVATAALVMIDAHEWFENRQRSSQR